MKITVKLSLILLLLFGGFIGFLVVIEITRRNSQVLLHASYEKENNKLFSHVLQLNQDKIFNPLKDNSTWDETIKYIAKPERNFEKVCLNTLLTTFNINHIWVYGENGEGIYYINDSANIDIKQFLPSKQVIKLLSAEHPFCHFFYYNSDQLFEIFGATVTTTFDDKHKEAPRGYLFFAKRWDTAFLNYLSNACGAKVMLDMNPGGKNLAVTHGRTVNYYPLKDIKGNVTGQIKVVNDILFQPEWDEKFLTAILISAIIGVLGMILIGFLLRTWISKPLNAIIYALDKGDEKHIIPVQNKSDEFGKIAKLILNNFKLKNDLKGEIESREITMRRFRLAAQSSQFGVWELDIRNDWFFWDDQVLKIFETPNSLIQADNRAILTRFQSEDLKRFNADIQRSIHGAREIEAEYKINLDNDNTRFISLRGIIIRDDSGEPHTLTGIIQDITEQKYSHEIIEASEEKFRLLSENISDVIWTMESTGRLVYVSPSVLPMLGYAPAEFMTLSFDEMFTAESARIVQIVFLENVEKIESGRRIENQIFVLEHYCKNKSVKWVEISVQGVYDQDNNFMFILGVTRDITDRKRFQDNLFQSENRFKQIAESTSDFIWEVDVDGLYTYCSEKVQDILGYSAAELIGKMHFYDLFLPESREELKRNAFSSFESRVNFKKFINPNLHKNGEAVILETSGAPIFDDRNQLIGYRGTDSDITLIQNNRLTLEREQKMLSAITSSVKDGIIMIDSQGNVTFWNESAASILGYSSAEITGKNFYDKILTQENNLKYRDAFADFSQTGQGYEIGKTIELSALRKDQIEVPVELSLSSLNLNDQWFAVGVLRDITERKRTERTLKESEERYKTVFKTSPDAVSLTNMEGVYLDVNEGFTQISGYLKEQVLGKSALDLRILVNDRDREELVEALQKHDIVDNFESAVRDKNGRIIPVLISASKTVVGNTSQLLLITKDISQRKKIEIELLKSKEQAEESSRLKSSLLMNMSHELRTPLNGILGFAGLLRNELNDSEQMSMVDIITLSGKRLMTTLNSIMDLAQVEANQMVLQIESTDIGGFTAEFIGNHSAMFERRAIRLNTEIEQNVCASIDKRLYTNILYHLIDNAIKYTEKGSVSIILQKTVKNNRPYVVLKVIDTGIGISSAQLGYIFDAFRQGKEGMSRSHEGSGLGLTLCQKFTALMDGEIEVESEPGAGSTFSVYFPLCNVQSLAPGAFNTGEEMTDMDLGIVKPKVLIVEDNEANSDLVVIYLKEQFVTDTALNGTQALELAQTNSYDLILMDINLGQGMDGIETLREIRMMEDYLNVPVIAVTGYSSDQEKQRILSEGFGEFLLKPFEKKELISVIAKTLKKGGDRR